MIDKEFVKQLATAVNSVVTASTKPLYEKIDKLQAELVELENKRETGMAAIDRHRCVLMAELEKLRWIYVSEKLPILKRAGEEGGLMSDWVRVTDGKKVVDAYYYDFTKREAKPNYATGKRWHCYGMRKSDIIAWQQIILPEQGEAKK